MVYVTHRGALFSTVGRSCAKGIAFSIEFAAIDLVAGVEGKGAADRLQRRTMDAHVLHGGRQQQEEHRLR